MLTNKQQPLNLKDCFIFSLNIRVSDRGVHVRMYMATDNEIPGFMTNARVYTHIHNELTYLQVDWLSNLPVIICRIVQGGRVN